MNKLTEQSMKKINKRIQQQEKKEPPTTNLDEKKPPAEEPKDRKIRFQAPPCSVCTATRDPSKNFSEVYSVHRVGEFTYHYCRCRWCRNTWKNATRNGIAVE